MGWQRHGLGSRLPQTSWRGWHVRGHCKGTSWPSEGVAGGRAVVQEGEAVGGDPVAEVGAEVVGVGVTVPAAVGIGN